MYSTITLSLILYHVQTCNSLLTKKVTTHKGFNQKKRTLTILGFFVVVVAVKTSFQHISGKTDFPFFNSVFSCR